jgi:CRISPR-associated protein Csm3
MIPHHRFVNRFEFRGFVMMETALHIGTGAGSPTSDAGVVRDFQGRPFIPGSSLKGALRSGVDRRVEWLGLHSCCLESNYTDCLTTNGRTDKDVEGEENGKKVKKPWRRYLLQWRLNEMESGLCDVCKLFGSTVFGGKVQVDDLPLAEPFEGVADALSEVRDGVGIDRDSGTAVDNIKFDYEVVPSLTAFRFYLTAENLESEELALLSLGLLEMMNGNVPLGGKSTRGLGRSRLRLSDVFHFEFPQGDAWEVGSLLDYLKPPQERESGLVENPRAFLETQISSFVNGD